eukprot:TRINITY_DN9936_c0_g1_i1.p1 TRINITY_DN9936_c0_g1~~TRINITY_DN9936_c0_g1_i1.p1  ORF type:complete len:715 (-),score=145.34 TRINITY_DN9936_c0_g1_i1:58-2202(-)
MKFGKYLAYQKSRLPQFRDHFLNYKKLKKLLKPLRRGGLDAGGEDSESAPLLTDQKRIPRTREEIEKAVDAFHLFLQVEKDRVNEFMAAALIDIEKAAFVIMDQLVPEKSTKKVMISIYQRGELLRNFMTVNMIAFQKIVKKYHKTMRLNQHAGDIAIEKYSPDDETLLLNQSPHDIFPAIRQLQTCLHRIEAFVASQFFDGDHNHAQRNLRIPTTTMSPKHVFIFAFFLGLDVALALLLVAFLLVPPSLGEVFFNVFPVFRCLFLFILYFWFWGGCLYIWERNRINHVYLLGFRPERTLTWVTVLKTSAILLFVWLLGFTLYVGTYKNKLRLIHPDNAYVIPLVTACVLLFLLVVPVRGFFHWSSRSAFLMLLLNLIITPFGRLGFLEFFAADQLTSMVVSLKDFQFLLCFFVTNNWEHPNDPVCHKVNVVGGPILAGLPYFWRALQCFRKYQETAQKLHLINLGKYIACLAVIVFSTLMVATTGHIHRVYFMIYLCCVPIATFYAYLWDIRMDWGHTLKCSRKTKRVEKSSGVDGKDVEGGGGDGNVDRKGRIATSSSGGGGDDAGIDRDARDGFESEIGEKEKVSRSLPLLRETLLYTWWGGYYAAMVINFFFRFAWIMTISTSEMFLPADYFSILIASVEIYRRCQWNLFRLENEMISNDEHYRKEELVPEPPAPHQSSCAAAHSPKELTFLEGLHSELKELQHSSINST